jgi:hypothetical protein
MPMSIRTPRGTKYSPTLTSRGVYVSRDGVTAYRSGRQEDGQLLVLAKSSASHAC